MSHGNKKYNFEDLKEPGSTIKVKTANLYSLKNSLRIYTKEHDLDMDKFDCVMLDLKHAKVTRTA